MANWWQRQAVSERGRLIQRNQYEWALARYCVAEKKSASRDIEEKIMMEVLPDLRERRRFRFALDLALEFCAASALPARPTPKTPTYG